MREGWIDGSMDLLDLLTRQTPIASYSFHGSLPIHDKRMLQGFFGRASLLRVQRQTFLQ